MKKILFLLVFMSSISNAEYDNTLTPEENVRKAKAELLEQQKKVGEMVGSMNQLLEPMVDPFGNRVCNEYNQARQDCASAGDIDRCITIKLQVKKAEYRQIEKKCE